MSDFSVIVPVYYGESYIQGIIDQIELCREYLNTDDYIEVLFINDAPDAPLTYRWKSETENVNVKIINTYKNVGIHAARLKGLKQCKGEYVLFLDQDDKIKAEYFKSQMLKLKDNDAVICKALKGEIPIYGDRDIFFENLPIKEFVFKEWNLIISPGQVLIKKKSIPNTWIENVMKFNGADDWFLWICMYAKNCKFSLNEEILYKHVLQDSNTSNDYMSMLQSEQEMMDIIQEKNILSDYDFKLLLKGFYKKNILRTRNLYRIKEKMETLIRWRKLKDRHIVISEYLFSQKARTVAIYGCGILGEYLYDELKTTSEVKYFIDINAKNLHKDIPVYTLEDSLPEVDSVIITLMDGAEYIEEELEKKGFTNISILKKCLANV